MNQNCIFLWTIAQLSIFAGQPAPPASNPELQSKVVKVAQDDSLILKPIRMLVKNKSGKILPFKHPPQSDSPAWCHHGGFPFHFINAAGVDIIWGAWSILLQKTPSMLEEFHFEEKGPEILAVAFDGSYVWAYFIGQKIRVWTLDGGLVAECDDKNGALPTDGPVRLAALKKGEVLAVGSFAKNQKFWCANLKLNGNSIKSDCFFRAEAPFQNSGRVSDSPNLQWGFMPFTLAELPNTEKSEDRIFVLERDRGGKYGLKIDPIKKSVEPYEFKLAAWPNGGESRRNYFRRANGQSMLAYMDEIRLFPPRESAAMQDRYETLLKIPSGRFFGKMFEHEGFIYAPGKPWIRMNPETLEMEILEDKQRRHIRWELIAGRSEHFGMILWNDKGKFFQALESDAKTMSTMSYESNVRGAAASKQIETLQPVVNACYRYRNACGLWPDDLSALVPTYLPAVPANMTYSNWRSGRTILELNRKSNKRQKRDRVAFCFDPHEEGWFRIDAKNIQMPLIGPPIPMLDSLTDSPAVVGAAIREFEARIAKTPDDEVLRTLQLEYLLAHEQADSALQAALNWVYDFPGSAGARQGLIESERLRRTGRRDFDPMLPFKNAPNDSMRLFADYPVLLRGGTIRRGVLDEFDTFATNETQWLIAEYAGLEYAKQYCYSDSESEAIMVCDRIEMEAKARNQDHNRSLELIRAGAKLRMGDFDGAKADATTFRDNAKEPLLFGYDNQELFEAIEKSNSEFKLEYWYYLPSTVNWPVDGD